MNKFIKNLVGEKSLIVTEVEDYIQVVFTSGDTLMIFNRCEIGQKGLPWHNLLLERVELDTHSIALIFSSGHLLTIDLEDAAFRGPEALALHTANGEIVVWQ